MPEAATLARPASLACLECRRKHLKCDGGTPACARCVDRGFSCNYTPSRRGCRPGKRRQIHETESPSSRTSPFYVPEPSQWTLAGMPGLDGPTEAVSASNNTVFDIQTALPALPDVLTTQQREGLPPWVDDEQLVNLYYLNFHNGHPILLPRSLYWTRNYPRFLKAVVEFIGSHFSSATSSDALREGTARELESGEQHTAEMVQARLLYAISLFGRNEVEESQNVLAQAVKAAIELGMYRREFAAAYAKNQPTEAESMRRTWYELYITDGCISAFHRKSSFQTNTINADVLLPCDDSAYEGGMCLLSSASKDDFENSVFADEELTFSSFCYRIEAVRILGRVLAITGEHGVHRDQVQAVDNALAAFLHHLPASKSEADIINTYGELDELMFQAHVVIQYATILLHFPRGDLASSVPFTTDVPGGNNARFLCTCTRQNVHSMKATDASKALSMLAAFRVPVQKHSPFFVYPLALGAIVQLSVLTIHSRSSSNCSEQHQDRIKLFLGVLKSFGRYWSVAEIILRALKKVALAALQSSRHEHSGPTQQHECTNSGIEPSSIATTDSIWLENFDILDLHGLIGFDTDASCL